jgi:hypothetical protein
LNTLPRLFLCVIFKLILLKLVRYRTSTKDFESEDREEVIEKKPLLDVNEEI